MRGTALSVVNRISEFIMRAFDVSESKIKLHRVLGLHLLGCIG